MSRRFGRNQKRRMREQIAQEEQRAAQASNQATMMRTMLELERGLMRETSDKLRDLEEFFGLVAARVGEYATISGLEPKYIRDMPRFDQWRTPVQTPAPIEPFSFENISAMDTVTIQDEIMRLLEIDVVRDNFAHQLHVRGLLGDGKIGYSISESALRRMTQQEITDRLVPEIAREVGRELVKLVKGSFR